MYLLLHYGKGGYENTLIFKPGVMNVFTAMHNSTTQVQNLTRGFCYYARAI